MKNKKITYLVFYFTGILSLLVVVFAYHLAIYFKPVTMVALGVLYVVNATHKNYVVLLNLFLFLVCEVLFLHNFMGNFRLLHILLSVYYLINVLLLWKSLQVIRISMKKVLTIQMFITMALISYILYAVTELIWPHISDRMIVLILLFFFIVFIGVCFNIYLNSKTIISYSLMVAASCFLIVNIMTSLNEFYLYMHMFPIVTTIIQFFGQFFLINFFIEQHKLKPSDMDYFEI